MLDVRDSPVDVANAVRPVERQPDERVNRAALVDLAHPVIAVRTDAKPGECIDEQLRMVAGVRRMTVAGLVRDVGQRAAHLVLDGVRGKERLGVHRIEVVDAVQELGLEAVRAQGADDHVEDDRPAQAADVDRPGRRLAVVDDLRPADRYGEFVGPVHRVLAPGRGRDFPAGGAGPVPAGAPASGSR